MYTIQTIYMEQYLGQCTNSTTIHLCSSMNEIPSRLASVKIMFQAPWSTNHIYRCSGMVVKPPTTTSSPFLHQWLDQGIYQNSYQPREANILNYLLPGPNYHHRSYFPGQGVYRKFSSHCQPSSHQHYYIFQLVQSTYQIHVALLIIY